MMPNEDVVDWLLDGDPAIRWQVMRDLVGASATAVERERKKVARQGWGALLLERQDEDGRWARGLYTPKWTSTTYTMLLLRDLGLPPTNAQAKRACRLLLDEGMRPDGGIHFGDRETSETCITGMVLSILAYFRFADDRLHTIADHLLRVQMPDGGWNCRRPRGATHASVHTTISVLEGLRQYELRQTRCGRDVRAAQKRGREFLLVHRLFRSHRRGTVMNSAFTRLTFPPRWHYDILRALDYFRDVNAPRDTRLAEAIDILHERMTDDGRWKLENRYQGKTFFEMERVGRESRWNTLRALRVLRWWNGRA